MIDENTPIFPNNVVKAIFDHITDGNLDEEVYPFMRPLRKTDPRVSLGVFASFWTPDERSFEFNGGALGGQTLGGAPSFPTLQRYMVSVQCSVTHGGQIEGLNKHSVFAKMVRDMLLVDPVLGVSLAGLSVTKNGITERMQRRWIPTQRYMSNEISGSFLYLATMELMIETETV
jgi:hypothetical protein